MARKCSKDDCEENAYVVNGFYLVGNVRVREWVCIDHYEATGRAKTEAEAPEYIKALERLERRMARPEPKRVVNLDERSVRVFERNGAGQAVRVGRVESWRWDGARLSGVI